MGGYFEFLGAGGEGKVGFFVRGEMERGEIFWSRGGGVWRNFWGRIRKRWVMRRVFWCGNRGMWRAERGWRLPERSVEMCELHSGLKFLEVIISGMDVTSEIFMIQFLHLEKALVTLSSHSIKTLVGVVLRK